MFPTITGVTLLGIALLLLVTGWALSIRKTNWFEGYNDRHWRLMYVFCVGSAVTWDLVTSVLVLNEVGVPDVLKYGSAVLLWAGILALLRVKGRLLPTRPRHLPDARDESG